jgi:hypothetical protein
MSNESKKKVKKLGWKAKGKRKQKKGEKGRQRIHLLPRVFCSVLKVWCYFAKQARPVL